jgi:hypothetical protein
MASYPKIYNVGHPSLDGFFDDGEICVEEKVDGSQFSFGRMEDGSVVMRSKRADVYPENPGMFAQAVEAVEKIISTYPVIVGAIYRCEYLRKPKHNVLAYGRVPDNHLVLFDIDFGVERYVSDRAALERLGQAIGLEVVPSLHVGVIKDVASVKNLMDTVSFLGGQNVEGLVFKRRGYRTIYGRDAKPLIAKYVSEDFREVHQRTAYRPQRADIRWYKAIQHLQDDGTFTQSPKDIGGLMREVQQDIETECKEEIAAVLYSHFRKHILRGCTRGLAEWYKEWLLGRQFEEDNDGEASGSD